MINRDWGTHTEFHTALAQSAADRMRHMVGSEASGCYLVEQWQESLKVVAINNGYIGILRERLSSGQPAKAGAQNYDARSIRRSHVQSLGSPP